eukprot:gene11865-12009_t
MKDPDTNIQDLPPLLLAHILSQCGSWKQLFSTIPLVCKTWKDVAQCVTLERLAFEFTVSPEGGLGPVTSHDMQQQNDSSLASWAMDSNLPPATTIVTSLQGPVVPLSQCKQQQGDNTVFTWLQQHRLRVKELSLGDVCLQDVCKLKLPLLQHLDLSGNASLGGAGSTSFQQVARFTHLQVLNISGWNLSSVAGSSSSSEVVTHALQPLQKMKSLQVLNMDGCGLVHFSAKPFSQLGQLISLSLADNPLTSSAVNQVCRLTQLQQLDLSGICKKGYVAPPLNGVQRLLCVSAAALNPPLRDKHCSVLAKCGQVRELNLAANDIGLKGLAALSGMLQLKQLDVAGNMKLWASAGTAAAASAGW